MSVRLFLRLEIVVLSDFIIFFSSLIDWGRYIRWLIFLLILGMFNSKLGLNGAVKEIPGWYWNITEP
jgi:hypothetical protein